MSTVNTRRSCAQAWRHHAAGLRPLTRDTVSGVVCMAGVGCQSSSRAGRCRTQPHLASPCRFSGSPPPHLAGVRFAASSSMTPAPLPTQSTSPFLKSWMRPMKPTMTTLRAWCAWTILVHTRAWRLTQAWQAAPPHPSTPITFKRLCLRHRCTCGRFRKVPRGPRRSTLTMRTRRRERRGKPRRCCRGRGG